MTNETTVEPEASREQAPFTGVDPAQLLLRLYNAYEPHVGNNLWPRETDRWHELVSCLLITLTGREIAPETIRDLKRLLEWAHLLDIERLGSLDPARRSSDGNDPHLVSIATILQNSGFTAEEAQTAVASICEAAKGFKDQYEGKVQKYFRHYGELMLSDLGRSFSFSSLDDDSVRRAFALWFQNVLNMPLLNPDVISEQACRQLTVTYDQLAQAADEENINVALLDNMLRSYWERDIELGDDEGDERV